MKDQLRPGQRIVDYAYLIAKIPQTGRLHPIETWLWNLSEEDFDEVMKWSPNE